MVGADKIPAHSGGQPEVELASMPFREGDIIAGKYEVIRLLGSGGMAFVVAASHMELDEKVALKFLRPECLANEDLVASFAREARASAKIQSEHVARVFDVGTIPESGPFIVMEYLAGRRRLDVPANISCRRARRSQRRTRSESCTATSSRRIYFWRATARD